MFKKICKINITNRRTLLVNYVIGHFSILSFQLNNKKILYENGNYTY